MKTRRAIALGVLALVGAGSAEAQSTAITTDEEAKADEDPSDVSEERELFRPPRLVGDSVPEYPEEVAQKVDTSVVLVLTIDEEGNVTEATIASAPQPGFDEAALVAARALRFSPASVDRKPTAVRVKFRYDFSVGPHKKPEPPRVRKPAPKQPSGRALNKKDPSADEAVLEVVIRGRSDSRIGVAELSPTEGSKVAGSLGDALNAVQSLPGVSAAANGSGGISIWGATPGETRVYIDGVPVPALYHRGGYRSVIHEGLVDRITMTPAAFGPEHGRALGGMVQLETRGAEGAGTHGQLGADLIGAQAFVSTRSAPSFGAMGAGRIGYLDVILPAVAPEVEQVIPLSAYRDYAGKVRWGESPTSYTEVSAFGALDAVQRNQPTVDPDSSRGEKLRESFHRLSARHFRLAGAHEDRLGAWLGFDQRDMQSAFSAVETRNETQRYRYGANASRSIFMGDAVSLTLGAELEGEHTRSERQGTLGLPAREGDIVAFGQSPATQVGFDRWTTDLVGLACFAAADIRPGAGVFTFSPSLRFEPILQMGDRLVPASNTPTVGYSRLDFAVSPRLEVKAQALENLSVQAAAGLVHQPAPPEDRSPVFGGTNLGLSHAGHGIFGLVYEIKRRLFLEVTGFSKYGWDLVVRNPVEPPPVAAALVDGGSSRTWGGQLLLRGRPHEAVSGWVSYTLSKAERRQGRAAAWRPSDFDQQHLFTVVASVQVSKSWNVGARARGASGLPRTEVIGAYYDARLDAYQPLFGSHNRDPLPFSFQLDLRAEWTKRFGSLNAVTLYLDLVNVTNQQNAVERTYNYDYSDSGYLTSLPILAVLGGRVDF